MRPPLKTQITDFFISVFILAIAVLMLLGAGVLVLGIVKLLVGGNE